jgi:sugar phosphate isomerase/epimerase/pimeloyl-ACP methyl ester carboxylesterase
MRLGIFAKIFVRPTLAETFDAVAASGLDCIQFNYACAGLPSLPEKIPHGLAKEIAAEAAKRKITIAAVSGTFNIIDSDAAKRREGLRRLEEMAAHCAALGTSLITLCTGTRDPQDMWRHHPENDSPKAWSEMLVSLATAIQIADKYNIFLGIEPETSNVVSSAARARLLLAEMKSPRLKIVMDASNLFHPGETTDREDLLTQALEILGGEIILAHAKDFRDSGKMEYMAPGQGDLPWAHYLRLLRTSGYCGPLIMHSLPETDAKPATAFLRKTMKETQRPARLPITSGFMRDGIHFNYQESGRGVPFIFQHGLTADVTQPFLLFQPPSGFRLYSFDCRAHGQTRPVGPEDKISIAAFADDLGAFMDHLKLEKAVVGGISMGAAVALNFTLRNPHRVRALVLQRPAWLDGPRKENVEVYSTMAQIIRQYGGVKGLDVFKATPLFQKIFKESPNAAKSLIGQFLHPRAEESVALLEKIPLDAPNLDRAEWRAINVPTLVLANRQDPIHPYEFGEIIAREIPGAEFKELTPKSVSVEKHNAEVQQFIEDFLLQHF